MTTPGQRPRRRGRLVPALAIAAAVAFGACSAGASPAAPTPSPVPPITGTGPIEGPGGAGPGPSGDPGLGGDRLVVPKPGQLDVHPISADAFTATVSGRHVVVTIAYTSGIEPCSVLDTIVVQRGSGTFAITLREGHGPGSQVCIMIAKLMKTLVDLGELDPGTYTITDTTGQAAPIEVVVR